MISNDGHDQWATTVNVTAQPWLSSKDREVILLCKDGIPLNDLVALGSSYEHVKLLEDRGHVVRSLLPRTGKRGRSKHLITSTDASLNLPYQFSSSKVLRPKGSGKRSKILDVIGDEELSLAEILNRIKRPSTNISACLLRLCSTGKLVRRRMMGKTNGFASSREFFIYRKP